jgi:hypothetical protein
VKYCLFILFFFVACSTFGQNKYWQQQVDYTITVSLDDKAQTLDGYVAMQYKNNAPDTLQFIWFHLWPNAYKNDKTAFSEQLLQNGRKDFYFSAESLKGYINRLDFRVDNTTALVVEDSIHIDVAKLVLPQPLPPGKTIQITTPFHVKLPYNFSRGGHIGQDYQITQWYPKPAVYDHKGWHPMPYLDQGEFYSEFGSFDVSITLPENYTVAATGVLQDASELDKLKAIGKTPVEEQAVYKQYKKFEQALKKTSKLTIDSFAITSAKGVKTLRYQQDNIHDFAWFASKTFLVQYDTVLLNKNSIDAFTFFHPNKKENWKKAISYTKNGIKNYSNWIGAYPYPVVSVVQGSKNEKSGGMEYPTITLITTQSGGQELDATIVHEVGHNWFYGILATNERQHPWMDEGINTYYQKRYELEQYGSYSYLKELAGFLQKRLPDDEEKMMLQTMFRLLKDQPIETPAAAFTQANYGLIAYIKSSRWVKRIAQTLGQTKFDKAMQHYYNQWQFKHPYPEDFKSALEQIAAQSLDSLFDQLNQTGQLETVQSKQKKPTQFSTFFNLRNTETVNNINITPVIGVNRYDKIMLGVAAHNYQLPLQPLQFHVGAAYATHSSKINTAARIAYTKYSKNVHTQFAVGWQQYTNNDFYSADEDKTLFQRFSRLTPSVAFTFFPKDMRSEERIRAKLTSFIMNRDALTFNTVNTPGGPISTVGLKNVAATINQLLVSWENNRVLYPFKHQLQIDQGKDFIRAGFTANMHFNYAKKGGMEARFFAGKFFYTSAKTIIKQFETDAYHLNMSGPRGYEDYTNSGYFMGRNEFEGLHSQQMMQRDGFFKVATDFLGSKVGKTDDWLMALNLSTTIPDGINILNALPIKIPLKVFADIGTYAEAWKDNPASGKFIYDAGFQIPVFNELINIYIPVLYSKVFSNYYKSTITEKRFMRTIAFTIDVQKLSVNRFSKYLPL